VRLNDSCSIGRVTLTVEIVQASWQEDDAISVGSEGVKLTAWIEVLDKKKSQRRTDGD